MPQLTLSVTAVTQINAGMVFASAAQWTVGFDHAALVAAKRSRADGYDILMRHTELGLVTVVGQTGLNTSSCTIEFIIAATIAAGTSDGKYRIHFGDLGATLPMLGAGGVAAPLDATATPGAVPAVALPSCGFSLVRTDSPDTDELPYPDFASPRAAARNQNDRATFQLAWPAISPEDWYEARAFFRAYKGGAGAWNPPAWLYGANVGIASTDILRIVGFNPTRTRMHLSATMDLERDAA